MKHLYFLFALVFIFFSDVALAQSNLKKENHEKFNLPPGSRLHPKAKIYDLSFKLDKGTTENVSYLQSDLKFLKELSEIEIENQKNENPEYYAYYQAGKNYINALSSKIKHIYTETELWYIYAFDQDLKNKLITVK